MRHWKSPSPVPFQLISHQPRRSLCYVCKDFEKESIRSHMSFSYFPGIKLTTRLGRKRIVKAEQIMILIWTRLSSRLLRCLEPVQFTTWGENSLLSFIGGVHIHCQMSMQLLGVKSLHSDGWKFHIFWYSCVVCESIFLNNSIKGCVFQSFLGML